MTTNPPGASPGSPLDDDTDARIDALARSAGSELRRPAPEHGLAGVQRAMRNRQVVRGAAGASAVLALVVGGFIVANNRDGDADLVPADPVSTTVEPDTNTVPTPTVAPTPGVTVPEPPSTAPREVPPADAPSVVYTSSESVQGDSIEMLVDPADGAVLSSRPVDPALSLGAQTELSIHGRTNADLGDVTYAFREVGFDSGTLATDIFPDVDLCAQNTVTVTSPNGSALPQRAVNLVVSPDDRSVATLSATCPEPGTMGADGMGTQLPFEWVLQVFDAQRPELPGRTLATIPSIEAFGRLTFSRDGRFIAADTIAGGGAVGYRFFDVDAGSEVDLGLDLTGCRAVGTRYATFARFIGPWIGDSSIALDIECDGRSTTLLVRDLMAPGSDFTTVAPTTVDPLSVIVEVDAAGYSTPGDSWFTICDIVGPTCWIGHGDDRLVELPAVTTASFLPLGYSPGN